MRVVLKPWNKSRAGNVILFVLLTLFFGFASIVVFGALLSGSMEFRDWPYLLSPLIAVVSAWALYSSRHQYCMDAVKGEMSFRELKERVEAEEYEEPLAFGPYFDEDGELHETTYRMLISDNWVLLGQDMSNPLCIPKANVVKVSGGRDVQEELDPGHPARNGYFFEFHLVNGEKFVTGDFAPEHLDKAEKMVREQFPLVEFTSFPSPSYSEPSSLLLHTESIETGMGYDDDADG